MFHALFTTLSEISAFYDRYNRDLLPEPFWDELYVVCDWDFLTPESDQVKEFRVVSCSQ